MSKFGKHLGASIFVLCLCLLAVSSAFAADWDDPTCEHPDAVRTAIKAGTCEEDGIYLYTCPDCNSTKTVTEKGHNFTLRNMPADCVNNARFGVFCTLCDEPDPAYAAQIVETPDTALGHDYVRTYKPADCSFAERTEITCTRCDYKENEFIKGGDPKLDHEYGEWQSLDAKNHIRFCSVGRESEKVACVFEKVEDATCMTYAEYECTEEKCGNTYFDEEAGYDATNHEYEKVTIKKATCTKNGIAQDVCACGKGDYLGGYSVIVAKHDYKPLSVIKAVTCEEDGIEEVYCPVCGETAERTVEKFAHKNAKMAIVEPATCGKDGVEQLYCPDCDEFIGPEGVIPATGKHTFEPTVKEATCEAPKTFGSFCSVCGASDPLVKPTTEGEKREHNLVTETMYADCVNPDRRVTRCTYNTEEGMEDGCEYVPVVDDLLDQGGDAKLDHNYGEETSLNNGKHIKICDRCKDEVIEDCNFEIPEGKEATCSTFDINVCKVCGYEFEDKVKGKNPTNHKYEEVVIKAPTCIKNGISQEVCACGEYGKYESIHAAHKLVTLSFTAPTCTEDGEAYKECAICPYTVTVTAKDDEDLAKLDHKNAKLSTITPATCGKDGEQQLLCPDCGEYIKEKSTIPATEKHTFVADVIEATCLAPRQIGSFCSVCGAVDPLHEPATEGEPRKHNIVTETKLADCENPDRRVTRCTYNTEDGDEDGCNYEPEVFELDEQGGDKKLDHNWSDFISLDNGKHMKFCDRCNEKVIEDCQFTTPEDRKSTCSTYGVEVCGVCKYEVEDKDGEFNPKNHGENMKPVVIKAPTCTKSGISQDVCTCGVTGSYYVTNPKHDLVEVSKTPATCEKEGLIKWMCKACPYTTEEVLKALEHKYDYATVKEPTCGEMGAKQKFCTVCLEKFGDEEDIDPTGKHVYQQDVKDATCTEPMQIGSFCKVCGQPEVGIEIIEQGNALGHDLKSVVQPANCEMNESSITTCSRCDYEVVVDLYDEGLGDKKLEHKLSDPVSLDNGKHIQICELCNEKIEEDCKFIVKTAATCSSYPVEVCELCEYEFVNEKSEYNSENHEPIITEIKAPTCTKSGIVQKVCGCGNLNVYATIPSKHQLEVTEYTAPTCTEDGKRVSKCAICPFTLTEGVEQDAELAKLDHKNKKYETIKQATCGTEGTQQYKCPDCGEFIGDEETVPATNDHKTFVAMDKPATCTENRMVGKFCAVCGTAEPGTVTEYPNTSIGHNLSSVTVDATCYTDEMLITTCSRCNYKNEKNLTEDDLGGEATKNHDFGKDPEYVSIGNQKHVVECLLCKEAIEFACAVDPEAKVDKKDLATCKTKATLTCGACGFRWVDKNGKFDADNHAVVVEHMKLPTCTKNGIDYESCDCDDDGIKSYETYVIVPAAHKKGEIVETTSATCVPGLVTYICSVCNETVTEIIEPDSDAKHEWSELMLNPQETIVYKYCFVCGTIDVVGKTGTEYSACYVLPKMAHTIIRVKETPVMTAGTKCADCGEVLTGCEPITCIHEWDEGVVTTEPTCATVGVKTFTCAKCDNTKTEDIAKLTTHTPAEAVQQNLVEATCTAEGSYDEVVLCKVCSVEISRTPKTVEMKEHTIVIDPAVPATADKDGLTEGSHCSVCEKVIVKQEVVPAAPHEHAFDEGKITTEATCLVEGVKTFTCLCGETKTEVIAKLAHTEKVLEAKPATCKEKGLTEGKICTACETVLVAQEEIPMLSHSYTVRFSFNADFTKKVKTSTCSICGDIQIEEMDF